MKSKSNNKTAEVARSLKLRRHFGEVKHSDTPLVDDYMRRIVEAVTTALDGTPRVLAMSGWGERLNLLWPPVQPELREVAEEARQELRELALHLIEATEARQLIGQQAGAKGAAPRRGGEKRARVMQQLREYRGSDEARVATVARRSGADKSYVRRLIRKTQD